MKKKSGWLWPLGVMATGFAGAAMLFRGCWHRKMSWPVRSQDHSYQVCLGCGVKRLFDEEVFRAYGPYSYDFNYLIAWNKSRVEEADEDVQERKAPEGAPYEVQQRLASFPREPVPDTSARAASPAVQERTAS